jgi:excisionase family DNA binding protein
VFSFSGPAASAIRPEEGLRISSAASARSGTRPPAAFELATHPAWDLTDQEVGVQRVADETGHFDHRQPALFQRRSRRPASATDENGPAIRKRFTQFLPTLCSAALLRSLTLPDQSWTGCGLFVDVKLDGFAEMPVYEQPFLTRYRHTCSLWRGELSSSRARQQAHQFLIRPIAKKTGGIGPATRTMEGNHEMPPFEELKTPIALLDIDQKQVEELYRKIVRSSAKLVGPDGRSQRLPASLYEFLRQLIADLYEGKSVSIIQNEAQLTTVEAARMLGVSRQFLVKQLEKNEIPFHLVGTHRRVYVRDLLAYKMQRDGKRRQILDELTRAETAEGLYDLEPLDEHAD